MADFMKNEVLNMQGITKYFPGVVALDNVNFNLYEGEVHALVGENGSGKSTLMNILSGVYRPDGGTMTVFGQSCVLKDTRDARANGIGTIFQELSLSPDLSVMENLFIGRQLRNRLGFIDKATMRRQCNELLARHSIQNVCADDIVGSLSLSRMQMIEIAKAIHLNARILIMDEPTAALTIAETETLFAQIQALKKNKCAIIFISHRLEEVKKIADRVTIIRDGRHILTEENAALDMDQIISAIVGKTFIQSKKQQSHTQPEIMLEAKNLSNQFLRDISFTLHRGEVLGIIGLVGAGRSELLQTLFGDLKYDSGEIRVRGKKVKLNSVRRAADHKLALVPEGRKTQGLFSALSVQENIEIVNRMYTSVGGFIATKIMRQKTRQVRDRLNIRTASLSADIVSLSGGNQQKAIIGRWLIHEPDVFLLDEPTHGIDVGAKGEIYQIINDLAKNGAGILLVSSEIPEILSLADRILVMYRGSITKEMINQDVTQEMIMAFISNQSVDVQELTPERKE